ncbi:MAG: ComF family protein [Anaerolineales bacterium]|nr:ComF family protein [Anaerolineales bacterium]
MLKRWTSLGLDLVFPPQCAGCGRIGHHICPECAQRVIPAPAPVCNRCGAPTPLPNSSRCRACGGPPAALRLARAAGLHTAPLREFIHQFKYEQRTDLAAPLACYLVAALQQPEWRAILPQIDVIVPVPLHSARRHERGYNQAELLATALSERVGIPCRAELLHRTRATRSQIGLSIDERKANVEDAFVASPQCNGLHILLVDDVYTTGSTLTACARAARAAGAPLICGLTLATPQHNQL